MNAQPASACLDSTPLSDSDFSFAPGESATQDIAGLFVDLYGCTSLSGNMKTSSTIPTIVKSRKAVSSPFHACDCHMRNHSPPTEMNATSHIRSESVSARAPPPTTDAPTPPPKKKWG